MDFYGISMDISSPYSTEEDTPFASSRSTFSDFFHGLWAGTGETLDIFGRGTGIDTLSDMGKSISETQYAKPDLQEYLGTQSQTSKIVTGTGQALPLSAAFMAGGIAGGAAGSLAGPVGTVAGGIAGTSAVGAAFAKGLYDKTVDEMIQTNPEMSLDEIESYAKKSVAIETLTEMADAGVSLVAGKVAGKLTGTGLRTALSNGLLSVDDVIAASAKRIGARQFAAAAFGDAALSGGSEVLADKLQYELDQSYDIESEAPDYFTTFMIGALISTPFGAGSALVEKRSQDKIRANIAKGLSSDDVTQRMYMANQVSENLQKASPEAAAIWDRYVEYNVKEGPLDINDPALQITTKQLDQQEWQKNLDTISKDRIYENLRKVSQPQYTDIVTKPEAILEAAGIPSGTAPSSPYGKGIAPPGVAPVTQESVVGPVEPQWKKDLRLSLKEQNALIDSEVTAYQEKAEVPKPEVSTVIPSPKPVAAEPTRKATEQTAQWKKWIYDNPKRIEEAMAELPEDSNTITKEQQDIAQQNAVNKRVEELKSKEKLTLAEKKEFQDLTGEKYTKAATKKAAAPKVLVESKKPTVVEQEKIDELQAKAKDLQEDVTDEKLTTEERLKAQKQLEEVKVEAAALQANDEVVPAGTATQVDKGGNLTRVIYDPAGWKQPKEKVAVYTNGNAILYRKGKDWLLAQKDEEGGKVKQPGRYASLKQAKEALAEGKLPAEVNPLDVKEETKAAPLTIAQKNLVAQTDVMKLTKQVLGSLKRSEDTDLGGFVIDGVTEAARRYDPASGIPFTTYAFKVAKGTVQQEITKRNKEGLMQDTTTEVAEGSERTSKVNSATAVDTQAAFEGGQEEGARRKKAKKGEGKQVAKEEPPPVTKVSTEEYQKEQEQKKKPTNLVERKQEREQELKVIKNKAEKSGKSLKEILKEEATKPKDSQGKNITNLPDNIKLKETKVGNKVIVEIAEYSTTMYHGTPSTEWEGEWKEGRPIFFTENKEQAGTYSGTKGTIKSRKITLKNPYVIDFQGRSWAHGPNGAGSAMEIAIRLREGKGADGILFINIVDPGPMEGQSSYNREPSTQVALFSNKSIELAEAKKVEPSEADVIVRKKTTKPSDLSASTDAVAILDRVKWDTTEAKALASNIVNKDHRAKVLAEIDSYTKTSAEAILNQYIKSAETSIASRGLANFLKKLLKDNQGKLSSMRIKIDPEIASPNYDPNTHTVNLQGVNAVDPTALHEIAHAITVRELYSNPKLRQEVLDLMKLAEKAALAEDLITQENLDKVKALSKRTGQEFKAEFNDIELPAGERTVLYALNNEFEFMAQAFNNKSFLQFLSTIPVPENYTRTPTSLKSAIKSIYDALVDIIASIFSSKNRTVSNSSMKRLLELFTELAGQDVSNWQAGSRTYGVDVLQSNIMRSAADLFSDSEINQAKQQVYKSREKLIEMNIEDFLNLAKKYTTDTYKEKRIKDVIDGGKKFSDIPFLQTETKGLSSFVVGHEGRHRAAYLAKAGYKTMPVIIKDSRIRWSEQENQNRFDYIEEWPVSLVGEDNRSSIPFPVTREQAGRDYSQNKIVDSFQADVATKKTNEERYQIMKELEVSLKDSPVAWVKKQATDVKDLIKDYAQSTTNRLARISQPISNALRKMEFRISRKNEAYSKEIKPFIDKYDKLSQKDRLLLDLALMNADGTNEYTKTRDDILSNNNMTEDFEKVKKVLAEIHQRKEAQGLNKYEDIPEYFPRKVKDLDALLQSMKNDGSYGRLEAAMDREGMSRADKEAAITSMINTGRRPQIAFKTPTSSQKREIDVVPETWKHHYLSTSEVLVNHIYESNEAIEARAMFGSTKRKQKAELRDKLYKTLESKRPESKGYNNTIKKIVELEAWLNRNTEEEYLEGISEYLEKSFTNVERGRKQREIDDLLKKRAAFSPNTPQYKRLSRGIDKRQKWLTDNPENPDVVGVDLLPKEQSDLVKLLRGRLTQAGMTGVWAAVRNLSLMSVLGNPMSAITQIGDTVFSVNDAGVESSLRAAFGDKMVSAKDLDLVHSLREFQSGKTAGWLDWALRKSGMTAMDKFGKELYMNAILNKAKKMSLEEFTSKWGKYLEGETESTYNDIKAGKKTENVMFFAFNALSEVQPITMSEMPLKYLTARNGRMFYALKSYNIRLLNNLYQRFSYNFREATTKQEKLRALGDASKLLALVVLAGASTDELKDFIQGKDVTSFSDRLTDNLLRVTLVNKYALSKADRDGFFNALASGILMPPLQLANDPYKDLKNLIDPEKEMSFYTLRNVPLVGKLGYSWFTETSKKSTYTNLKTNILEDYKDNRSISRIRKEMNKYNRWARGAKEPLITYSTLRNAIRREKK